MDKMQVGRATVAFKRRDEISCHVIESLLMQTECFQVVVRQDSSGASAPTPKRKPSQNDGHMLSHRGLEFTHSAVEKVGSQVCVALHGLQYMTNTRSRSHFACKVRLTPCSIVLQTRHSLCSEADGMRRPDARSCAPWSSPLGRLLHTLRGHIPPLSISQSAAYLVVKIFCELGLPGSNAKNSSGRPYRYLPSCMPDFHERLPRLLSFFCVRETNFTR